MPLSPGRAQTVEVETNTCGQASVEISQPQPVAGTTRVDIQVIRPDHPADGARPGGPAGAGMVVGSGSTLVTWSAPAPPVGIAPPAAIAPPSTFGPPAPPITGPGPLRAPRVEINITGPQQATVGERVHFTVTLTNRGQTTATGLTITDTFDPGLVIEKFPGQNRIRRTIPDDLRPGEFIEIDADFTVAKAGLLGQTVEVTGPGGLRATAQAYITAVQAGTTLPPGPVGPGVPPTPGAAGTLTVRMIAKPGTAEVGDNSARSTLPRSATAC